MGVTSANYENGKEGILGVVREILESSISEEDFEDARKNHGWMKVQMLKRRRGRMRVLIINGGRQGRNIARRLLTEDEFPRL